MLAKTLNNLKENTHIFSIYKIPLFTTNIFLMTHLPKKKKNKNTKYKEKFKRKEFLFVFLPKILKYIDIPMQHLSFFFLYMYHKHYLSVRRQTPLSL